MEVNESLNKKVASKEEEISFLAGQEQKHKKAVSDAVKSEEKMRDTLANRTKHFDDHRKRKDDELQSMKARAKAKVEALSAQHKADAKRHKRSHDKEVKQQQSVLHKKLRSEQKCIVKLKDALEKRDL